MTDAPRRTHPWLKTLKLLPTYGWLSLLRTSEFKFNFYSYIFLYGSQIAFYVFFWQQVSPDPRGGWSAEACMLLIGFGLISTSLQELIWSTGMVDQMILNGDLMVVLVRPENSFFGLVLRRFALMALFPASMGLALVIWVISTQDSMSWSGLLPALLTCTLGSVCLRCLLLTINSLGFTFGRVTSLKSVVFSSKEFARYPMDILGPWATTFLCSLFPVLLASNWSAQMVFRMEGLEILTTLALAFAIAVAWFLFTAWFWTRGLRKYEAQSL